MRRRRIAIAGMGLLLVAAVARHPSADVRILTHAANDPAPHQVRAALDLGVMAFSLLITWTGEHFS